MEVFTIRLVVGLGYNDNIRKSQSRLDLQSLRSTTCKKITLLTDANIKSQQAEILEIEGYIQWICCIFLTSVADASEMCV